MTTDSQVAASSAIGWLTLDTPAQTTPGTSITFVGTYTGTVSSLDYNFGSGWVQASSVTFDNGSFSFTVPSGVDAGSYAPQVRNHDNTAVGATAGTFIVDPWTPQTLTTSPGATAVFEFNASDPADASVASDSTIHKVVNSLNTSEWLTAVTATGGNGIVIADNSGADGTRRLLRFHATKISPNSYDPSTDWLSAGGVDGSGGEALVDLANSPSIGTQGAFTSVIALYIDKSYSYAAGPIWGTSEATGQLQYAQIRYNGATGKTGAQIWDPDGNGGSADVNTISAGWHVMTMIKTGNTILYRLDGQQVSTVALNSTQTFTATDFMIGGGFAPTIGSGENGVPPTYVGEFQAYSGVLQGTDLANAEKLAGNSIGLTLSPVVSDPLIVADAVTGAPVAAVLTAYTGPLAGPQSSYINVTGESLTINASTPNWFIYSGPGNDVIGVSGGNNVLDGGGGSNYLQGGSGTDSFFMDARGASPSGPWNTLANFHADDSATIWGISASDFSLTWQDGQGTGPTTGLTLHATDAAGDVASVTLGGWTSADLSNGRLSVAFGTDPNTGIVYTSIHANG